MKQGYELLVRMLDPDASRGHSKVTTVPLTDSEDPLEGAKAFVDYLAGLDEEERRAITVMDYRHRGGRGSQDYSNLLEQRLQAEGPAEPDREQQDREEPHD